MFIRPRTVDATGPLMSVHTIALTVVGALVGLLVVVYAVMIYNGLVRLNRNIDRAWSNIDVLRKQRADELDKLIDTVEQYMDYEERVLQEVTEARERVRQADNPDEASNADAQLEGALANLFARAEDYPDLKAQDSFQQLQDRISSLEEQIADRREFYNESVNTYNIRIKQIPYNIVAGLMNYQARDLFEADESELQDVDVGDAFGS
jgi:LemA protein